MAGATRPGSRMVSSSTLRTPSRNTSATTAAAATARRVLPTPPGPVRVTRRTTGSRNRATISARSPSRPISGVSGVGSERVGARSAASIDEAFTGRQGGSLGPIVDAQLGDEVGDVGLDRTGADEERLGNFAVGFALGEETEHIEFARGKGVGIGSRRRRTLPERVLDQTGQVGDRLIERDRTAAPHRLAVRILAQPGAQFGTDRFDVVILEQANDAGCNHRGLD